MNITASDTINITVEFTAPEGHLIMPDAGTFSYTVLGLDGSIIQPSITPVLPPTASETIITIGSPITDLTTGGDFLNLRLRYQYAFEGRVQTVRIPLTITKELPYTVTEADVKALLGATSLTLPTDSINIYNMYLKLKNSSDIGSVDLDEQLVSGGYPSVLANKAIVLSSACEAIDVLKLTRVKTHTEDNISITHFEADLKDLKKSLMGQYYEVVGELNPALAGELSTVSQTFLVANPDPDVITGVSAT